jgi:hypothetical protein
MALVSTTVEVYTRDFTKTHANFFIGDYVTNYYR